MTELDRTTEHLPIVNATRFVVFTVSGSVRPPRRSISVVVKATFSLVTGEITAEQRPPSGDRRVGEDDDLHAPLTYGSDFAPFKLRADVTLSGFGYPPKGQAAGTVDLELGELFRTIAIFGPRHWDRLGGQTAPLPFERVALTHHYAYGGPGHAPNPAGRGRCGDALPQLEAPDGLVTSRASCPGTIACFAPIPSTWNERARRLGRYGRRWLKLRWPFFPADFDWSYFNAAPRSLQVDFLRGDEAYRLSGVQPSGHPLTGRLPGVVPCAFVQRVADGSLVKVPLNLDTVHFDTDALEGVLLWRGVAELEDVDGTELARLFVCEASTSEAAVDEGDAADRLAVELANEDADDDDLITDDGPLPPAPAAPSRQEVLRRIGAGEDLSGADLSRVDLAGADLSGIDLSEAVLHGAVLDGANLTQANLAGAILTEASAIGCAMQGADLTGADLAAGNFCSARFDGAILRDASLAGAQLIEARLAGAEAAGASLVDVSAYQAIFDDADLTGADLSGADLRTATFRRAAIGDAMMYDCRAVGAVMDDATGQDLRGDGSDLSGASLCGLRAPGASFEAATLCRARLSGCIMPDANFARANLVGSIADGGDFREASFRKADLQGAFFPGSNLMEADFQDADLREADLRTTNLYQAEVWGASLAGSNREGAIVAGTKLERSGT